MKQPATVLEVLDICETQKRTAERRQREKQKAESERMSKKAKNGRR